MMSKKILITGASGFIGSFLVEEALSQGYEVFAGVRRSSSRQYLQDSRIHFFELDFDEPSTLGRAFESFYSEQGSFDYIIHNAGITQAKRRDQFYQVNYDHTRTLLQSVKDAGHNISKFILINSLASYGPGDRFSMQPIHFMDAPNPVSDYGKSKLLASNYVRLESGLPHLIIHPTAVYGPRDKDFFQFIKLINKGIEPYVGRHKQMISMIYVQDLARAVIQLLASPAVNYSFIISDGNSYDKEELGETASKALGKKTFKFKLPLKPVQLTVSAIEEIQQLLFNSRPFLNKDKLNEISSANWLCDSKEVWEHINDSPQFNLEKGITETIAWYRKNKWL